MKENEEIEKYLNNKQIAFNQATQKVRTWIGGRGSGKTVGGIAISLLEKANAMPGAKGVYGSKSVDQLKNNTFPEIEKMWKSVGLIEGYHYVKFRKPPKWFKQALSPPNSFSNVITFFNGFTIMLFSAVQMDFIRGGSFDFAELDEAAFFKRDFFFKVLNPAIRGNLQYFGHLACHHQVSIYSSMPWKEGFKWPLEFEKLAIAHPEKYFYMESTTLDNIDIYGRDKFEQDKITTGYLEFQVEYMNMRIDQGENPFYHGYADDKHLYSPVTEYKSKSGRLMKRKIFRNPDQLLDLSFDFSGWFNCCTIYQKKKNIEYMIDAFGVHENQSLNVLVDDIVKEYKDQRRKHVRLWGEPRGHDKSPFGMTMYEALSKRFRHHGWTVSIEATASPARNHEDRWLKINALLEESTPGWPSLRMNEDRCKDVALSIKLTEVTPDFKKNKKKEKDKSFPQEHAPHYTDTIDNYFSQKYPWLFDDEDDYGHGGEVDF